VFVVANYLTRLTKVEASFHPIISIAAAPFVAQQDSNLELAGDFSLGVLPVPDDG
jgi:hypothetical protein